MVTDPNLILYTCISKDSTILAEFPSSQNPLHNTAKQCLNLTPPFHSTFSQTIRSRSYTFLIDPPFVFFAIHHPSLPKTHTLAFLDSLRTAFYPLLESGPTRVSDTFSEGCMQRKLEPLFRMAIGCGAQRVEKLERGVSVSPLLGGGLIKKIKNKKKNAGDGDCDRDRDPDRKGLLSVFRIGSGMYVNDVHTVKKVWRRHIAVVLGLDFVVCGVMFAIWLSVCKGFKCIDP